MSVKVLMRRSAPPPPPRSFMDTFLDKFTDFTTAASRARKPAGDEPLSVFDRVKEFFVFNGPRIDLETLQQLMSKVKMPLLIALGVAAAAAVAYGVYRLYKHFSTAKTEEERQQAEENALETFVKDVRSVAPDLMKIEGWEASLRAEAEKAILEHSDPASLVEKLTKIKAAAKEHQESINPANVGSGLGLMEIKAMTRRPGKQQKHKKVGRGARVPMMM